VKVKLAHRRHEQNVLRLCNDKDTVLTGKSLIDIEVESVSMYTFVPQFLPLLAAPLKTSFSNTNVCIIALRLMFAASTNRVLYHSMSYEFREQKRFTNDKNV
jgi:hypothetical protein